MGLIKEFKEFINRGNVIDLAVGVVIAGAFNPIIQSFVKDIIMPPIGKMLGGADFSTLKYVIGEKTLEDGTLEQISINYGTFINTIISFIITAFAVFMVVKAYNSMKKAEVAAPAEPSAQEVLLGEIRDLLKK